MEKTSASLKTSEKGRNSLNPRVPNKIQTISVREEIMLRGLGTSEEQITHLYKCRELYTKSKLCNTNGREIREERKIRNTRRIHSTLPVRKLIYKLNR